MFKDFGKRYFLVTLMLSLAIGIMIHFQMVINFLFGEEVGRHGGRYIVSLSHLGSEFLITVLVAFLMFTLNYYILKPVDKHARLNGLTILIAVLLTLISVFIINHFFYSLLDIIDKEPRPRGYRDEFILQEFFCFGFGNRLHPYHTSY